MGATCSQPREEAPPRLEDIIYERKEYTSTYRPDKRKLWTTYYLEDRRERDEGRKDALDDWPGVFGFQMETLQVQPDDDNSDHEQSQAVKSDGSHPDVWFDPKYDKYGDLKTGQILESGLDGKIGKSKLWNASLPTAERIKLSEKRASSRRRRNSLSQASTSGATDDETSSLGESEMGLRSPANTPISRGFVPMMRSLDGTDDADLLLDDQEGMPRTRSMSRGGISEEEEADGFDGEFGGTNEEGLPNGKSSSMNMGMNGREGDIKQSNVVQSMSPRSQFRVTLAMLNGMTEDQAINYNAVCKAREERQEKERRAYLAKQLGMSIKEVNAIAKRDAQDGNAGSSSSSANNSSNIQDGQGQGQGQRENGTRDEVGEREGGAGRGQGKDQEAEMKKGKKKTGSGENGSPGESGEITNRDEGEKEQMEEGDNGKDKGRKKGKSKDKTKTGAEDEAEEEKKEKRTVKQIAPKGKRLGGEEQVVIEGAKLVGRSEFVWWEEKMLEDVSDPKAWNPFASQEGQFKLYQGTVSKGLEGAEVQMKKDIQIFKAYIFVPNATPLDCFEAMYDLNVRKQWDSDYDANEILRAFSGHPFHNDIWYSRTVSVPLFKARDFLTMRAYSLYKSAFNVLKHRRAKTQVPEADIDDTFMDPDIAASDLIAIKDPSSVSASGYALTNKLNAANKLKKNEKRKNKSTPHAEPEGGYSDDLYAPVEAATYIYRSVDHSSMPPVDDVVRAVCQGAGFMFQVPLSDRFPPNVKELDLSLAQGRTGTFFIIMSASDPQLNLFARAAADKLAVDGFTKWCRRFIEFVSGRIAKTAN